MKRKAYFISILILTLTSIFSMSGDSDITPVAPMKTIAQLQGYVTKNVWLDQEKEVDVAKYQSMKSEYLKKAEELGKKGYDGDDFWEHRINLDVYEQLKKDGEISERWEAEFRTPEEKILRSQIIVIGEVISHEYDERKMARFKTSCKIKVDEVLYNRYFLNEVPPELVVKTEGDLRISHRSYELNLEIGKKYLLFLSKYFFHLKFLLKK